MKIITILITIFLMSFVIWICKNDTNRYTNVQNEKLTESIKRGSAIYADFCISCHLPSGEGVKHVYPPLANSDYLKNNRTESIRGVKFGQQGKITVNGKVYDNYMPPMGLEDDEIADVMNYINHSWGNNYGEIITPQEVTKVIKK